MHNLESADSVHVVTSGGGEDFSDYEALLSYSEGGDQIKEGINGASF